jgi:hypothetical protein
VALDLTSNWRWMFTDPAHNLVPNPQFEIDATAWGTTGVTLTRVIVDQIRTAGLVTVTTAGAAGSRYIFSDPFPVTAGHTYYPRARVRMSTPTSRRLLINVWFYNSGGTVIGYANATSAAVTTAWTQLAATADAPTGAVNARIVIADYDDDTQIGDAWHVAFAIVDDAEQVYIFERNPREMSSPTRERATTAMAHAVDGRIRAARTRTPPAEWTFTGDIRTQTHHDTLLTWSRKPGRIHLRDHLHRTWEIAITQFDLTEEIPTQRTPWKANYTMRALVFRRVA